MMDGVWSTNNSNNTEVATTVERASTNQSSFSRHTWLIDVLSVAWSMYNKYLSCWTSPSFCHRASSNTTILILRMGRHEHEGRTTGRRTWEPLGNTMLACWRWYRPPCSPTLYSCSAPMNACLLACLFGSSCREVILSIITFFLTNPVPPSHHFSMRLISDQIGDYENWTLI